MDKMAFASLLIGLLVGLQPVRVEVSVDLKPAAVVFYLDGSPAGGAAAAPWVAKIDFGRELRSHELTAVAMDANGNRIEAISRIVNMPAPASRVDILLEKNSQGRLARARLVATSVQRDKPMKESLTLDGRVLRLDAGASAALPPLNLDRTHILSAVAEFNQATVARADIALGGGIADLSGSRLTAIGIRVEPGSEPSVETLDGRLRRGSDTLRVVAVEKGTATVLLVRDPSSYFVEHTIARNTAGTGVRLDEGDRVGLVWPLAHEEHIGQQVAMLLESTPYFSSRDGGLLWVLSRVSRKTPSRPPYLYADAVAVAGLEGFYAGTRRAVVLAGRFENDASQLSPAQVRPYLRDLGIPLHTWTFGDLESPWGQAVPLASFADYQRDAAELKRDLNSQRIVWLAGEWEPGRIELLPGPDGASLLR
jgi:hypothetical protein